MFCIVYLKILKLYRLKKYFGECIANYFDLYIDTENIIKQKILFLSYTYRIGIILHLKVDYTTKLYVFTTKKPKKYYFLKYVALWAALIKSKLFIKLILKLDAY